MVVNDFLYFFKWESYILIYFVKNDFVCDDLEIKFFFVLFFYLYIRNLFVNCIYWFMFIRNLMWIFDEGDEFVFFFLFDGYCLINW